MQPFGVLDRYIGKTIFTTIMMTLFMLVSLSGIIKFVDQLKKAGQGSYDALGAGMYTLLSVPERCANLLPDGGSAWGVAWSWDAGAAQRTGGDAGFWFYPYAGGAVGDENRHSAGLADDGDW
ncbi:putative permease [Escherichia coli]|uniref:Putative permease n=1 Tax=Escherichia coli TaxID=562 RepID=A0A2X1Q0Q5_ECOLX|nr:putative permease [Escherichia coli]